MHAPDAVRYLRMKSRRKDLPVRKEPTMDTTATGMCFGACPHHAHTKVRNATHTANNGRDGHASFHKCRACTDAYAVAVEERGGGGGPRTNGPETQHPA
jgi:hypothetical protein